MLQPTPRKSPKKSPVTYASSGVNYDSMDPIKRLAQLKAKATAPLLQPHGMTEVAASRGESAYVWEGPDAFWALVIEGLGTKSMVADATRKITGLTHYQGIAQDTVAMIVNDIIVVGAAPLVVNAYFAVGSSAWFEDEERATDLINGWAAACQQTGATWGGGESPTLKGIIAPDEIDLGGSCVGIIQPKERLVLGDALQAGDAIVLIQSSGIHANGLTLARTIASQLPKGYGTKLPNGTLYGEALLAPTILYAPLVRDLFAAGITIHYMANITGHGWRKLMRASQDFRYVIETMPEVPPIFDFIQAQSGNNDQEMYGNFNMGAGFALYVAPEFVPQIVTIAKKHKLTATHAGVVEKGPKQVIIKPKNITFAGEALKVR